MKAANHEQTWLAVLLAFGVALNTAAQPASGGDNAPARVEPTSRGLDESAFRIVSERNIFNANRSGAGQVRGPSRRPSSVEWFTLVGTMEYEKGTFAFFEGSSSQLTKVMKAEEVIAGHKVLGISADGVKLQADGKDIELPVGSQMRREDEGAWQVAEARGGSNLASSANGESSSRNGRTDRGDSSSRSRRDDSSPRGNDNSTSSSRPATSTTAPTGANEDEVLKRLMERREKESQ